MDGNDNFLHLSSDDKPLELTTEAMAEEKSKLTAAGLNDFQSDFVVNVKIIRTVLGEEWAIKNLARTVNDSENKTRLEQQDIMTREEAQFYFIKIIHLGQHLLSLKDETNFYSFVEKIALESNFYALYAEVKVAAFFKEAGFSIEFIIESGIKGRDFDLRISKGDFSARVEVKNRIPLEKEKLENFSKSTIKNTLGDARKQLMEKGEVTDEPVMTFMLLPEQWVFERE